MKTDFNSLMNIRRSNYLYLQNLLKSTKIKTIKLNNNTIPLTMPILIENRDKVRGN